VLPRRCCLPARHRIDSIGAHAAHHFGARFNGQVSLHVHVALESAGDAYVAGALDLAFDCQARRQQRFLRVAARLSSCSCGRLRAVSSSPERQQAFPASPVSGVVCSRRIGLSTTP
jgi:hypothetical protein